MVEMLQPEVALPIGGVGKRTSGRWGVLALIATEGSLFGYLLFTYFISGFSNRTALAARRLA